MGTSVVVEVYHWEHILEYHTIMHISLAFVIAAALCAVAADAAPQPAMDTLMSSAAEFFPFAANHREKRQLAGKSDSPFYIISTKYIDPAELNAAYKYRRCYTILACVKTCYDRDAKDPTCCLVTRDCE